MKTKLIFINILILLILISGNYAQNLIKNGGFELVKDQIKLYGENPLLNLLMIICLLIKIPKE